MVVKLKPLAEQVIVVTGATSGNGLAVVEQAVKAGAGVVAVARNAGTLEELQARLSAEGARIVTRASWRRTLLDHRGTGIDAPPWLWHAVVDLSGSHEAGYLEHCRRYALAQV